MKLFTYYHDTEKGKADLAVQRADKARFPDQESWTAYETSVSAEATDTLKGGIKTVFGSLVALALIVAFGWLIFMTFSNAPWWAAAIILLLVLAIVL